MFAFFATCFGEITIFACAYVNAGSGGEMAADAILSILRLSMGFSTDTWFYDERTMEKHGINICTALPNSFIPTNLV